MSGNVSSCIWAAWALACFVTTCIPGRSSSVHNVPALSRVIFMKILWFTIYLTAIIVSLPCIEPLKLIFLLNQCPAVSISNA